MNKFRSSASPRDILIKIDCKHCYHTNIFFKLADTTVIKSKVIKIGEGIEGFTHCKRIKLCDKCGVGLPVEEFDLVKDSESRRRCIYYNGIKDEEIKKGSYILSPTYKFGEEFNMKDAKYEGRLT